MTKTIHFFFSALPGWAMDKYGEAWTNPGLIPSNGPFVIDDWVPGESIRLVRNQLLPAELAGEGNLGVVELQITDGDAEQDYQLWKDGQVDYVVLRKQQYEEHFRDTPEQTTEVLEGLVVQYFIFDTSKPPFDNVHLRRAFSAALERETLVEETLDGGVPMIHLGPPSAFGAPAVDEVGVGYDPEYALAELDLAGYPECAGLPPLQFASIARNLSNYGVSIARSWEESLGCPEGTINFQGHIDYADADKIGWHILGVAWTADFPDEDNWVGTILSCEGTFLMPGRECSDVDDLIEQARQEYRPSERVSLYRQIEEWFFGEEGSFPIAPLYTQIRYYAASDWVTLEPGIYPHLMDWTDTRIDMEAKEAGVGE